jgi:hypothetical protein
LQLHKYTNIDTQFAGKFVIATADEEIAAALLNKLTRNGLLTHPSTDPIPAQPRLEAASKTYSASGLASKPRDVAIGLSAGHPQSHFPHPSSTGIWSQEHIARHHCRSRKSPLRDKTLEQQRQRQRQPSLPLPLFCPQILAVAATSIPLYKTNCNRPVPALRPTTDQPTSRPLTNFAVAMQ